MSNDENVLDHTIHNIEGDAAAENQAIRLRSGINVR